MLTSTRLSLRQQRRLPFPACSCRLISVLFLGSDNVSLPTLKALHGALSPASPPGASHITSLGVLCPGTRPMGRGQAATALPVAQYALAQGLPCLQVPYGTRDLTAPGFWGALQGFLGGYDLGVVVSFGYMLPAALLAGLPLGAINLHPSALPRHRGAAPVPHTLLAGDAATAVSIIEVHPTRMDAGAILAQRHVPIGPTLAAPALTAQLAELGAADMLHTVLNLAAARAAARVQEEAAATRAPKLKPEHGRVAWASATAPHLLRMDRAYQGSIGLHCQVQGPGSSSSSGGAATAGRVKLLELGEALPEALALLPRLHPPPGSLVHLGTGAGAGRQRQLYVATCEGGWVEVKQLQLEGKTAVSGAVYALGRQAPSTGVTALDTVLV